MEEHHMDHMDNLRERVDALERHARRVERQARWWRGIACGAMVVGLVSLPLSAGTAKNDQPTAAEYHGWKQRVAALEYKLKYIEGGANEVVITGANLRIVNGLGATNTTNGLGNLIVGYNESRATSDDCQGLPPQPLCVDRRTGSHNVVGGQLSNFSSFGGLVVGRFNEISEQFASVSGGFQNTASGVAASVSGGQSNFAVELGASVSGGARNVASGRTASILGGTANRAIELSASISGGINNTASGQNASVSGGQGNTASGVAASVSGGHNRTAAAEFSWAAAFLFADDF
jgi:hypothetical protein